MSAKRPTPVVQMLVFETLKRLQMTRTLIPDMTGCRWLALVCAKE